MLERTLSLLLLNLPKILGALLVLVIGWMIAHLLANAVGGAINKCKTMNEKVGKIFGETSSATATKTIVRIVYYIIMIFVLIAVFQILDLTIITDPLRNFLNMIFGYLPQILGAFILAALAWIIASLLRTLVVRGLTALKIDERILKTGEDKACMVKTAGEIAFWLVILMFLPAILGTLALQGILAPIQHLVDQLVAFLPNLLGAAIVVGIGWFIASRVGELAARLTQSLGVDKLGVKADEESPKLSGIIGTTVYVLILIPVLITGLRLIGLTAISDPAVAMLNSIFVYLPKLFSALIIVYIAYLLGRIIGNLAAGILSKFGFDNLLVILGLAAEKSSKTSLSAVLGNLVTILIVFLASLEAANILGFTMIAGLADQFLVLFGHILLGLVIIAVGLYLARIIGDVISNRSSAYPRLLSLIARVSIVGLALAMGLRQMGLANEIINLAFGLLLGALAVAAAIAFGLGGREMAAKKLQEIEEFAKTQK